MRVLEDLCDMLEDELKQITKKEDITPQELESAYKAVDIMKDIETIKAMKQSDERGYSQRPWYSYDEWDYSRDGRGGYDRGGSYRGDSYRGGSYNDGSYARGGRDGDGDGRYNEGRSRDDGYSRHEDTGHLMQKLDEMQRKIDKMK